MRHGSGINPSNRFEKTERTADAELLDWDDEFLRAQTNRQIEYLPDTSRSIISENQSPDVPFRYSLNPYRGCVHGWICWLISPRSVNPFSGKDLRPYFSRFGEGGR